MVTHSIRALMFLDVETGYKGILFAVGDDLLMDTVEYKEKVREQVGYLVDIKNIDDEDFLQDFERVIDRLSKGQDASFMDWHISYKETELFTLSC